jgi:hypothetical protein
MKAAKKRSAKPRVSARDTRMASAQKRAIAKRDKALRKELEKTGRETDNGIRVTGLPHANPNLIEA